MSAGSASALRSRWPWLALATVLLAVLVVVIARVLRFSDVGEAFLEVYPGAAPQPAGVAAGFPAWAAWQHGLNALFLLFTVRRGGCASPTGR